MPHWADILLCILSTSALFIGLKEVQRRGRNLLQAVTWNYVTAAVTGFAFSPSFFSSVAGSGFSATALALILGASFVSIFFLMGVGAQKLGLALTGILSKTALVLPAIFSWAFYGDDLGALRIMGLVLALVAVVLVNYSPARTPSGGMLGGGLLLAIVLFFGNGVNDCLFKVFDREFSSGIKGEEFTVFVFMTAAAIGTAIVVFQLAAGKTKFDRVAVLLGIAIGIPNYFSLVFLTRSLSWFSGTTFFPVNNLGILLIVAIAGLIFYREKFRLINYVGLLVACASILLLL